MTGWGYPHDDCGHVFAKGCLESHLHRDISAVDGVDFQPRLDGKPIQFKGYIRIFKNSCHRQTCPVCWTDWASRIAKESVKRLNAFRLKKRKLSPIHIVVSVPVKDYSLGIRAMRKKVYIALSDTHCLGGMIVYHSKRKRCVRCHAPKPFKKDICLKCHGIEFEWYYSPHFHVVGYGWLVHTDEQYKKTGYLVHNEGVRDSVEGTIFYQLSHAGYKKNVRSVNWFGFLSRKKLKLPEEPKVKDSCPFCGSRLKRLAFVGDVSHSIPQIVGYEAYGDLLGWIYDVKKIHSSGG